MMNYEEDIGILYNVSYGGFQISQKALDEYNKRNLLINPTEEIITCCCDGFIERTNTLLCQIYKELGREFNGENSKIKIKIKYIQKRYENHYLITDYDGKEEIVINYATYALDEIKKVIDNVKISNHEKINTIRDMYYINMHNEYSSKT